MIKCPNCKSVDIYSEGFGITSIVYNVNTGNVDDYDDHIEWDGDIYTDSKLRCDNCRYEWYRIMARQRTIVD